MTDFTSSNSGSAKMAAMQEALANNPNVKAKFKLKIKIEKKEPNKNERKREADDR